MPHTLNQPIGRRQQNRQAHQYAIKEVHSIATPVCSGAFERPRSWKQGNPVSSPGIEGLRMQTVYYSLMRNLLAFLLFTGAATFLPAQDSGKTPAPMRASIVDSHEGITIGVEPWTQASRYKEKFPKKSPLAAGIVAIHISIRNDNDQGVKVDLHR